MKIILELFELIAIFITTFVVIIGGGIGLFVLLANTIK